MNRNIYLTGFMGSGKTTVGRTLARVLGRPFKDLDRIIESRSGEPISQTFETRGEGFFRALESECLEELAGQSRSVIAAGGGLPMSERNRDLMRGSGLIVHLKADLETCRGRMAGADTGTGAAVRPLWQDGPALERLFQSRQQAYADTE